MLKRTKSLARMIAEVVAVGLLFFWQLCIAAAVGSGSGPGYLILNDHQMLVNLGKPDTVSRFLIEDVTPCIAQDKVSPIYACTKEELKGTVSSLGTVYDSSAPPLGSVMFVPIAQGAGSVNVLFTFPQNRLSGNRLYRFTYWQKAGTGKESATTMSVDTTPIVTVTARPEVNGQYRFTLSSSLAYMRMGKNLFRSPPPDCPNIGSADAKNPTKWTTIGFQASGTAVGPGPASINGLLAPLDDYAGPWPPTTYADSPLFGAAFVCINSRSLIADFTPDSSGPATVLAGIQSPLQLPPNAGHYKTQGDVSDTNFVTYTVTDSTDWAFAQGTKFSPTTTPPTGKTDARFYANVTMVAATGARFAWGLDGKIAELQREIGKSAWTITWLSATTNIGNNTSSIKGQTYSDSIDWTLPISHEWDTVMGHTTTVVFVANPDFSTDIEFDRKNLLADAHFVWTPRSLYSTLFEENNPVGGTLWKYPNPSQHHVGSELQFQAGVEAGGALMDTTQKASSGKATITVPAYNIARVVPQIHGLFQWLPLKSTGLGQLTIDETIAGRYLMATENTVEQYNIPATATATATVGLLARPISGWKAYNSLVTTWYPPRSAIAGFTATYNDGFNASKFSRIDSITFGVTIIY